jgi:hypothetical protein
MRYLKLILILLFIFTFYIQAHCQPVHISGGNQVFTDANCDQAKYHQFGIVCQDTDDGKVYKWSGAAEIEITGSATGDVTGASSSSDSELPLFSGTSGKTLKRSNTLTGIPKLTSGVVSMATADTDYLTPSTAASTYLTISTAASTYAAGASASSDSELPLFSGTGGKTLKRSNTLTGIPKLTSGVISMATADTDYLTPSTAASTYAPKVSPTFTGTPILPTGYKIFDGGTHYYLINVPTLSADVSLTLPSSAVQAGDILYGASAGTLTLLPKGSAHDLLQINATETAPEWTSSITIGAIKDTVKFCDADNCATRYFLFDIGNLTAGRTIYPPDMDSYIPYYGSNPTVNTAGQIAIDTTANQIKAYGSALSIHDPRRSESFVIKSPVSTDDFLLMKAPFGMQVSQLDCVAQGITPSLTVEVQECNSNGASCASIGLSVSPVAADTNYSDAPTTNPEPIAADAWLKVMTTLTSGTVNFVTCTVRYTVTGE